VSEAPVNDEVKVEVLRFDLVYKNT